jgi:HEAT repeat protein
MKKIASLLTISALTICLTTALGQTKQVGILDFYGTITNEADLRKCLPFKVGDTLDYLTETAFPTVKKIVEDCLLAQPKIKQAEVSFVCCDEIEGKWIAFVGVDTIISHLLKSTHTDDLTLPAEIQSTYDCLMNLLLVAIEKGEATENDSSGHSLMNYLPARQLQEKFITYANQHVSLLRKVLRLSKHPDQREVASTVIAYYHDKTEIINDLLGAVTDPDEDVRNNAVRAIGIIADYAQRNPDLHIGIPADPFIEMMHSIAWTDRNKSSFVLLSLTNNKNKKLLMQLKQQALKPIVDMAKWKSYGHSYPGYVMLGRIAGWSDEKIINGINSDREQLVEKMLGDINNGVLPLR